MIHFHKWVWHSYRVIAVWDSRPSEYPIEYRTELYGTCDICEAPRTKLINGAWRPPAGSDMIEVRANNG